MLLATFIYWASSSTLPRYNDWQFFTWGSDVLFGEHYAFIRATDYIEGSAPGGLHLYANYPFLQIGPPAILLAKLLQFGPREGLYMGGAVVQSLGLLAVYCLDRALDDETRRHRVKVLVGGAVVTTLWIALTHVTHLDDALTLAGMAGAVWAIKSGRMVLAGSLLGVAAASKPWGIVLLALVLVAPQWPARVKAAAAACLVICAFWAPFIIADPATLNVGTVTLVTLPGSVLSALVGTQLVAHPTFLRAAQFIVGLSLAAVIIAFTRWWPLAPLAALSVRLLLEPGPYQYYATGVVLAALLADLSMRSLRLPWMTLLVTGSWLTVEVADDQVVSGWTRLITYVLVLTVCVLVAVRGRFRPAVA